MEAVTFQVLYEDHASDVRRLAHYLTGDADLAAEITSETFLRAWASHDRIRTETAKAYLLSIARNLAVDLQRRRRITVPVDESHSSAAPVESARLELDFVMSELRGLPSEFRDPLLLTAVHGLSYDEAARALAVPLALVKVRIHRARLKLAEALGMKKEPKV